MDFRSLMPLSRRDVAGAEQDPFTVIRRDMDRLFDEMARGFGMPRAWGDGGTVPRVDVQETDKAIEVKAELPGVEEKDLDLQLAEGMLTIKGEKKQEREEGEKGKGYYMMERSYGSFFRRIPLPAEVQQDKVEARFKNGVLTVSLPKSPEAAAKVKRIEVKGG